ncbi:odorant receptor 30a-like [Tenebrio molitor]|uniref:odorant receptor 30a-like n=1 Tax=Tenebrio molitor TaxID=7067 RepID=UPI0036247FFB
MCAITATCFIIACIDLITLKMQHLNENLESVKELPQQQKKEKLVWCVNYHVHIIGLTEEYNNIFSNINAVHFTLSAVVMVLLIHQVLHEMVLKQAVQLCGWFFIIGLSCHAGQKLINESFSVSQTLYFLDWYEYESQLKYYIKIIMVRSQKELSITAGILNQYSYQFFHRILQGAYTYMTVLARYK